MSQPENNERGRLYLYLIIAGAAWGVVDLVAGGLLGPLALPSKSIFLIPLGILAMSTGRARTGLGGSCALMGLGAALFRMAVGAGGRCPNGFLCTPVALALQGVTLEGTVRLLRAGVGRSRMSWASAGALAGALSPVLFAAAATVFMGWSGGLDTVVAYAAPRVPFCFLGGAVASTLGARLGALHRLPAPERQRADTA